MSSGEAGVVYDGWHGGEARLCGWGGSWVDRQTEADCCLASRASFASRFLFSCIFLILASFLFLITNRASSTHRWLMAKATPSLA